MSLSFSYNGQTIHVISLYYLLYLIQFDTKEIHLTREVKVLSLERQPNKNFYHLVTRGQEILSRNASD